MDLAHHTVGGKPRFVLGGSIGGISPDFTPGIRRLNKAFAQASTIMLGRISDDLAADDAVLAIDGDMALVAKGRDREIDRLAAVRTRLGL